MSIQKNQNRDYVIPRPESTGEADGRYALHFYQMESETLQMALTHCNDSAMCTRLLLVMEEAAAANEYLNAYVLVVLDRKDKDFVIHVSFRELDLFLGEFPGVQVAGMNGEQVKQHYQNLFPENQREELAEEKAV